MKKDRPKVELGLGHVAPCGPPEFISLVQMEMREARKRAFEILGIKDPKHRARARFGPRPHVAIANGKRTGTCKGCGVPWSDRNPSCPNCRARHEMRAIYARRASASL